MRQIAANYIFPGSGSCLKNGIIILTDEGIVEKVIDTGGNIHESAGLEFYNGIVVPGFINAHCHLELSHMQGLIPEKTGLPGFIGRITKQRFAGIEEIKKHAWKAHFEMIHNGIVAVGDICNTSASFEIKKKKDILYHSFIEVYGSDPKIAEKKIQDALKLSSLIESKYPHNHSIIPHAPYSVSNNLLQRIVESNTNGLLSFHNQESASENLLFEKNTGPLLEALVALEPSFIRNNTSGVNPLLSIISQLGKNRKLLPVHNTYTRAKDIQSIKKRDLQIFWILCPGANLYIENRLPDIPLLKENNPIALGTDSLASNHQLSILEEMKLISSHYPNIHLTELVKWGTLNGAKALNMEKEIGSLEPGKRPGVNLIHQADLKNLKLTEKSWVEKLV